MHKTQGMVMEEIQKYRKDNIHYFHHLLAMMKSNHIQRCLLDNKFLKVENNIDIKELDSDKEEYLDNKTKYPILAINFLVGMDLSANLLVDDMDLPFNLNPQGLSDNLITNMISHKLYTDHFFFIGT